MRSIVLFFFMAASISFSAQQTDQAVGLRGGFSSGITYQHFHSSSEDVKLLLSFREGGAQLTGLFEIYKPVMIGYYDQFFLYYGLGVHADSPVMKTDGGVATTVGKEVTPPRDP